MIFFVDESGDPTILDRKGKDLPAEGKENKNAFRIFVQESSQLPMLQVVDYALWTVNRAYERGDYRFYNYMLERISLVQDIFDKANYPNTYYTPKHPLDDKKISPAGG